MLYPAVAHWNSECFLNIERRRIQLTTTNIIATAIIQVHLVSSTNLMSPKTYFLKIRGVIIYKVRSENGEV